MTSVNINVTTNKKGKQTMRNKFKELSTDWTNAANASRKAHKGTKLTKAHKRHIKQGIAEWIATKEGTVIEAIKVGEDT